MPDLGWKWTVIEPGDDPMQGCGGLPADLVDELLASAPDGSERERRRLVLEDIEARLRENGPRQAQPSPDRASQFMPFAALKGYNELIAQVERQHGCG